VLAHFGGAPARYAAFVADAIADVPATPDTPVAGSARFLEAHLPPRRPSPEIPRRAWDLRRPSLRELLTSYERDQAIATAYREHGYRMAEIAEELGCHYATVSRRLHAWERRQMS
jgi:DNA-directed RNA polymerase specialized sigma24 family protein